MCKSSQNILVSIDGLTSLYVTYKPADDQHDNKTRNQNIPMNIVSKSIDYTYQQTKSQGIHYRTRYIKTLSFYFYRIPG